MKRRICALHDDLLVRILLFVPTKDAVATTILSKRWRYVWTMLPALEFKGGKESTGWFTDKSLQLHKAPILHTLAIKLGPNCPVDLDVCKWVDKAVNQCVKILKFKIFWNAEPTSFPKSLYTCNTLVFLNLSNQILVDVCFPACLPALLYLRLYYVVYKDQDSLPMLLSSCPVLKSLRVKRYKDDNLKQLTVKVPSLLKLVYFTCNEDEDEDEDEDVDENEDEDVDENENEDLDENENENEDEDVDENEDVGMDVDVDVDVDDPTGSLVIDCPALTHLELLDVWGDYLLIENMPCLNVAKLRVATNPDFMFLRSLSSVEELRLSWTESMVAYCNTIKFPRLLNLRFVTNDSETCLKSLMFMLQNSPKIQTLTIRNIEGEDLSTSWNQPSTIPGCLSSHLEYFGWIDYGRQEDEKQLVRYILANAKCLKTVKFFLSETCNFEETQQELESMPRISTSSKLRFFTQAEFKGGKSRYR